MPDVVINKLPPRDISVVTNETPRVSEVQEIAVTPVKNKFNPLSVVWSALSFTPQPAEQIIDTKQKDNSYIYIIFAILVIFGAAYFVFRKRK